jgi:uncharacterized protein
MRRFIPWVLVPALLGYALVCAAVYTTQTSQIFRATPLPADHRFRFPGDVVEVRIPVDDTSLHGLYFSAQNAKGAVLYLHGNGGTVDLWGAYGATYVSRGYDALIIDYRGYGKSEGYIDGEAQLHTDMQAAYEFLKQRHPEDRIVIVGRSIGTGLAARLASQNNPRHLILESPYHSLTEIVSQQFPWLPVSLLLRYPLPTHQWLPQVRCPITVVHGTADTVVPFASARKLVDAFPGKIELVVLEGAGHVGFERLTLYQSMLDQIFP